MDKLIKLEFKPRIERSKQGTRETTLEKLSVQNGGRKTVFISYANRGRWQRSGGTLAVSRKSPAIAG